MNASDLPSENVLVTLHDRKPVPRVIDFAVAKATNQRRPHPPWDFTA